MSSPGIILTSKYSLPNSKDFTKFVNYLTREKALLKETTLTKSEQKELKMIRMQKKRLFRKPDEHVANIQHDSDQSEMKREANHLVNDDFDFDHLEKMDFTKMVTYMARSYALRQKSVKTLHDKVEINRLNQAMNKIIDKQTEDPDTTNILNGVFDKNNNFLSVDDLEEVKTKFQTAQKNGSVMYQDVVSFDNNFLKKIGLLDDHNNLREDRLKVASNEMMAEMFEVEGMKDTGYWFASIHRNTDNIHIHFATVESTNTRKIIRQGKFLQPKGKRRQKTIDLMKQTFTHNILDRSTELARISNLRNDLVKDIKVDFSDSKSRKVNQLMSQLYRSLPRDRSCWHYGAVGNEAPTKKQISSKSRLILNELTTELIKNNPKFHEYKELVKNESDFDKTVYGKSKRDSKDYEATKLRDLKKRLGNSVLKELKDSQRKKTKVVAKLNEYEKSKNQFKKQYYQQHYYQRSQKNYRVVPPRYVPYFNRKLERVMNNDLEKQRAQYFYEKMQREVERTQKTY